MALIVVSQNPVEYAANTQRPSLILLAPVLNAREPNRQLARLVLYAANPTPWPFAIGGVVVGKVARVQGARVQAIAGSVAAIGDPIPAVVANVVGVQARIVAGTVQAIGEEVVPAVAEIVGVEAHIVAGSLSANGSEVASVVVPCGAPAKKKAKPVPRVIPGVARVNGARCTAEAGKIHALGSGVALIATAKFNAQAGQVKASGITNPTDEELILIFGEVA